MVPMLFGPMIRIEAARARDTSAACSLVPASPISAYPPVERITEGTPLAAQSARASGTAALGITIMARSTGPGTSLTR